MKTLTNISLLCVCVVAGLALLTLRASHDLSIFRVPFEMASGDKPGWNRDVGDKFNFYVEQQEKGMGWKVTNTSETIACPDSDVKVDQSSDSTKFPYKTVINCEAVRAGDASITIQQIGHGTTVEKTFTFKVE